MRALPTGARLPAGSRTLAGPSAFRVPVWALAFAPHPYGAGCPLAPETLGWLCAAPIPRLTGVALVGMSRPCLSEDVQTAREGTPEPVKC